MMFSLYQPSIIFVYRVINFSVKEKISSVEGQNRENITIFSFFMMLFYVVDCCFSICGIIYFCYYFPFESISNVVLLLNCMVISNNTL